MNVKFTFFISRSLKKKIAELFSLSASTVRNYLSKMTSKIGAKIRIEVARIAKQKVGYDLSQ